MPYVPGHVPQATGAEAEWRDCWAAVGAWGIDAASRGRVDLSPTDVRRLARVPDDDGGTLADMARAFVRKRLWRKRVRSGGKRRLSAQYLDDRTPAKMRALFKAKPSGGGKLYLAESDFEVAPNYAVCQPGFNKRRNAYHAIGIVPGEGKGKRKGMIRVMDPLCRKMTWWKIGDVIRAIRRYNDEMAHEKLGTADLIVVNVPDRR